MGVLCGPSFFSSSTLLSDRGQQQQAVVVNLEAPAYFCLHFALKEPSSHPRVTNGEFCTQAVVFSPSSAISSSSWWHVAMAPHRVKL